MTVSVLAHGAYPISPTPFLPDGQIDYDSIDRLVDFYHATGVTGITVLGQLGEPTKMDGQESFDLVRAFVKKARGLPVVVGVTAPGFATMRALAHVSMDAGAAAVMVAPVPTLKTDAQIVNYFDQVVEALGTDVPFILQDYPLTIPVYFTPDVIRRIINAHQSCVVFKHEDWPGLEKLSALKNFIADGSMRRIPIFCGQGGLFLDHELERGADGSMTGYAFPELLVRAQTLNAECRRDEFRDLFDAHLPYLRYENQLGLGVAARKYLLKKRGALAHETMRKPFMPLSERGKAEVDYLVERLLRKDPLPLKIVD